MLSPGVHVSSLLLCRGARQGSMSTGSDEWCIERVAEAIQPPDALGRGPSRESLTAFIALWATPGKWSVVLDVMPPKEPRISVVTFPVIDRWVCERPTEFKTCTVDLDRLILPGSDGVLLCVRSNGRPLAYLPVPMMERRSEQAQAPPAREPPR